MLASKHILTLMMNTTNNDVIAPDYTTLFINVRAQEISILARELRAASFGAITHREAIERARAFLASSPLRQAA